MCCDALHNTVAQPPFNISTYGSTTLHSSPVHVYHNLFNHWVLKEIYLLQTVLQCVYVYVCWGAGRGGEVHKITGRVRREIVINPLQYYITRCCSFGEACLCYSIPCAVDCSQWMPHGRAKGSGPTQQLTWYRLDLRVCSALAVSSGDVCWGGQTGCTVGLVRYCHRFPSLAFLLSLFCSLPLSLEA